MIEIETCRRLAADDVAPVRALCGTASVYDAEAGFAAIDPATVLAVNAAPEPPFQVLVRYKHEFVHDPDLPFEIAAYGLLEPDGSDPRTGWLRYVVLPAFRSLGISTMAAETIGLGQGKGAMLDELPFKQVRWWAYGSHPAADRFARRFGLQVVDETWRVIGAVRGPLALSLDPDPASDSSVTETPAAEAIEAVAAAAAQGGDLRGTAHPGTSVGELGEVDAAWLLARDPAGVVIGFAVVLPEWRRRDGRKVASVLEVGCAPADRATHQALLTAAASHLRDSGAEIVDFDLDPRDERTLGVTRRLGFEVEDVHTCYAWTRATE